MSPLASHVFCDDAMKDFNPKVWVSVSDDFNLERVTKTILESATSGPMAEFKEFNKSPFHVGALGSKIVVTTRDANVAKMMGSTVYQLDCISDDQCWKVFEHYSLLDITNNRPQNFGLVKKKIVAKCSGLSLAARTLGGLLRCKQVEEWEEILNNKMWSLSDNNGILPVLKFSYHYLPSSLKRCFAYCSLLPNDYEFGEKQLILLWVAEGLVQQQPEDKKQFEDTGSDYFQELLSRSLFQKASKSNDKYVICLMANLIGKERLDSLELKWSYLSGSREMELGMLDMLQPPKNLKELTIKCYAGLKFSLWIGGPLFSNMVRVSLYNCSNCHLLPPVGQLPCLKELYIMGMSAVEVVGPEFYGEGSLPFRVLEILKCSDMKHWEKWLRFDQDMSSGVFPGLKFLSIQMCPKLGGELPKKLNLLTTLEIVRCEELVVAVANYEQVRELKIVGCKALVHSTTVVDLKLLETLCLSNILELRLQAGVFTKGLGKIKELTILSCEQLTASLKNEDRCFPHLISHVRLVVEDNSALVEDLGKELEGLLQVPILACKLEYLEINKCECLSKLPKGLHQLSSLQELHIRHCSRLVSFPDVGLPPSLTVLKITECDSLMYISKYQIPRNLKRIHISWCRSSKSLVEEEKELVGSSSSSFSLCLEHLEISVCPSLTSLSLRGQLYRALKHLEIFTCWVQNARPTCEQLELIAPDGFFRDNTNNSLEYISIGSCQNLKSLPEGLCHLSNLQAFMVSNCASLVSIPRLSWGRRASNLKEIRITGYEKLVVLPEDIHNLASLQELEIDFLEGLTSFPPNLTSLQVYEVKSCKKL
ncbi:hypothetical protein DVH24_038279 [Malus domestica]|uniref:Uncharacterized protein n=1 Tax=Malus domestica TaxID=3750 RepID=A0A498KE18_MALDO|nr:hypothetical protein DVH24_038279 [Malus domestica]